MDCCNGSGKLVLARFFIDGEPKPQPRPRATLRPGAKHASIHTPQGPIKSWKECIMWAGKLNRFAEPLDVPLIVHLEFLLPRPKGRSTSNSWLPLEKWKTGEPYPHLGRPDRDNLDKAVLDALTQVGFWRDDSLVFSGNIKKMVAGSGERVGCSVIIEADTNYMSREDIDNIKKLTNHDSKTEQLENSSVISSVNTRKIQEF